MQLDKVVVKGPPQRWGQPLENWDNWTADTAPAEIEGAVVEAANQGQNRFDVRMQNVKRFSIWLHPKMVDFSKPVTVSINGETVCERRVEPSLAAMMRSWDRRRDWGLLYHAELVVDVP